MNNQQADGYYDEQDLSLDSKEINLDFLDEENND